MSTGEGINGYVLNATTGALATVAGNSLPSGAGAISTDAAGKFVFAIDTANNSIVTLQPESGGALMQVAVSPAGTSPFVNIAVSPGK